MRSLGSLAFLSFVAAVLVGCGGGGNDATPVPAGRYIGSWTSEFDDGATGTAAIAIAADRSISGTMKADDVTGFSSDGVARGEIKASGKASLVGLWYWENQEVPLGEDFQGNLHYDPATGVLKGTLRRSRGDFSSRHVWTLTRQP